MGYCFCFVSTFIKEILRNCVSANFGGGEPFINPFINDFLKEIKHDAELSFNTNGTTLSDSTLSLLENRPNLIVNISIDGIGHHNNYIRSGSAWEDIETNVKRLKEKNIRVLFYYILQHTSLFTFRPVYEYCMENDIALEIGEIYSGSVDGSGHLTLSSADKLDVDRFKKWLYSLEYFIKKNIKTSCLTYSKCCKRIEAYRAGCGTKTCRR